jgi:hypothetical protein
MAPFGGPTSPGAVGRKALGAATLVSALFGVLGDARWFAASAAFGTAWWGWDFLFANVFGPLGDWLTAMLTGAATVEEPPDLSLDDTIRLLESHLGAEGVPRHVQIQSALRLAEIYRLNKRDPQRARDVIDKVKSRWPDAPELRGLQRVMEEGSGDNPGPVG